jgi:peptidoglycan hydrolase CwlO-like protein
MMSQQEMLKKKAAIQMRINEKRIDDMQKTQQNLREKFIHVNDFMKECLHKTERAEEEIAAEQEEQETLKGEIEVIERDLKELSSFEEKFKEIVKEFQPYVDVFNEVIEASEFQSFEDLMSRCDSLRMC